MPLDVPGERPDFVVTTSWDDGHQCDLRLAELLDRYGLRGTFYIAPLNRELEVKARLTSSDVLDLASRHEIGGHTLTHIPLTRLDPRTAFNEIAHGKSHLEDLTGAPVDSFCYPRGAYGPVHPALVREAGFLSGRTVTRLKFSPGPDPFTQATTIHTYRHLVDAPWLLRNSGTNVMRAWRCYRDWAIFAVQLFEEFLQRGGVYHLWGHSWEIQDREEWESLERVFAHIAGRAGVLYTTNGEVTARHR